MEMKNLRGIKRENSEGIIFHSSKILKINEHFKENYPPGNMEIVSSKISEEIDLRLNLCSSVKDTPKKGLQVAEDPVTPNTNIKMLTSLAASLDYANCGTPKSTKTVQLKTSDEIFQCDDKGLAVPAIKPSRKEKSLSLVCHKFLDIYPLHPEQDARTIVSLDDVSKKLKIERRRLYDIVNVFESIDMLRKISKNRYIWNGVNNLLNALHKIKIAAINEGIERKLQYVLKSEECKPSIRNYCILDEVQEFSKNLAMENEYEIRKLITSVPHFPGVRKEKSLAVMSQKFLMLFLVSPSNSVSLNVAAKVLNGFQKNSKGAQIKTQIRRLYDIANVLSSIGLIQKEVTKSINGRKPAFKYIGPLLSDSQVKENLPKTPNKSSSKIKPRSLIRHSSFQEICAVAELERQKLYLEEAPKSAPPFERHVKETLDRSQVNFEDIHIDVKKSENELNLHINQEKGKGDKHSNALRNIQPNSVNGIKAITVIPAPPKWKVLNVPMPSSSNQKSFYILNNFSYINLPISTGTSLLNKENDHINKTKLTEKKVEENKVVSSQAIEDTQRDTILKSLNLSLSPGQVATIQLMGTSQSNLSIPKMPYNIVKVIDQNNEVKSAKVNKDNEYQFQNNSNSSSVRYDSPFSMPSGYVTPILSASSDVLSLPSNSIVDSLLKKIENRSSPIDVNQKKGFLYFNSTDTTNRVESLKISTKDVYEAQKNKSPLKEMISDNSSSESLNAEVSNILKEVPLESSVTANRSRSFLIDEKTILSPIKKPEPSTAPVTPSPLMTPPYITPDTKFIFNPCGKFQNPIFLISNNLLLKDKRIV